MSSATETTPSPEQKNFFQRNAGNIVGLIAFGLMALAIALDYLRK